MNQDVHDALCFALWHHQGGSSTIGQLIRKMLDLGQHDYMDKDELEGAKRVQRALANSEKPAREWVGLTETEKYTLADDVARRGVPVFDAISEAEAKLREKNA